MGGLVPPPRSTRLHLLLRAVRHRRRRWLHVQNCLAELHMMDKFFLRVKLGRVAEGGQSILSSICCDRPLLHTHAIWGWTTI